MKESKVFIGLGSNLNDPYQQLITACQALKVIDKTKFIRVSSFYQTKPQGGPPNQSNYLNAVALLITSLTPHDLLKALQRIEDRQGRVRIKKWGPRTLDLDILLFENQKINDEQLTIPHPLMKQRDFVLIPLREIEPNLKLDFL
ncbi:MAG: putative 2-amino-4-hydroxy-6-hydroxymethyldihydropteridine pyrophosphokinae [Francisellaceae bacterium]|nr:putative 2-amino-4-hydroxy-6-hydroxymethyldihydropteridine pyrophosphokinae [Francisellaceae bacterium]